MKRPRRRIARIRRTGIAVIDRQQSPSLANARRAAAAGSMTEIDCRTRRPGRNRSVLRAERRIARIDHARVARAHGNRRSGRALAGSVARTCGVTRIDCRARRSGCCWRVEDALYGIAGRNDAWAAGCKRERRSGAAGTGTITGSRCVTRVHRWARRPARGWRVRTRARCRVARACDMARIARRADHWIRPDTST